MTDDKHSYRHSEGAVEWYTPQAYIDAAKVVLNGIDLDPASCHEANKRVGARAYCDEQMSGLEHPWIGSVFLNPPGNKKGEKYAIQKWVDKMFSELRKGRTSHAIFVAFNANICSRWWQPLWCGHICVPPRRVKFFKNGTEAGNPTHPSAFVYLPGAIDRSDIFATVFGGHGHIIHPMGCQCQ